MSLYPATLLVPGWSDTGKKLQYARSFLLEQGWPGDRVAVMDFRDRYGSNVDHAQEIAAAVLKLRSRTGAAQVAVVAHSMGGLALRYYLTTPAGQRSVRTAIFVGTPHRGTWVAMLAWGRGGREMRPGSAFLRALAAHPVPPTVRAVCIRTRFDTRVLPGGSAFLDGAECLLVRRPAHSSMMRHRATLELVQRVLLSEPA